MIYVNESECAGIYISEGFHESHYCEWCNGWHWCRPFESVEEATRQLIREMNIEAIQEALGVKINVEVEMDGAHKENVVEWHLMDEASPPEGLDVLVTREHLGRNVITIDSVFDFDDGMALWYNGDETYKAWAYLPEPYDDSDAPDGRLTDEV